MTNNAASTTYGALSQTSASPSVPNVASVYSEDYLVIAIPSGSSVFTYLGSLNPPVPPVNMALVPLMFVDTVGGESLLRYPGALVTSSTAPSGYTVMVPVVTSAAGVSPETIQWHRVLEPVYQADMSGSTEGPFSPIFSSSSTSSSSSTTGSTSGIVAIRLNYPFQAASISGYQQNPVDASYVGTVMQADDSGVTAANSVPNGGSPVAPDGQFSATYGGQYGLGEQGGTALSAGGATPAAVRVPASALRPSDLPPRSVFPVAQSPRIPTQGNLDERQQPGSLIPPSALCRSR